MNDDIQSQVNELRRRFQEKNREIHNEVCKAVKKCTLKVEASAKRNLVRNRKVDTGRLLGSVDNRTFYEDNLIVGEVGTNVEYGPDIEFGTSPHEIKPKNANALVWTDEQGNKHIAKKVNHPGTPPSPFLYPALEENRQFIKKEIGDAIKKVTD